MRLGKWTTNQLNSLLDLLDLSRGSGEDGVKVRYSPYKNTDTSNCEFFLANSISSSRHEDMQPDPM